MADRPILFSAPMVRALLDGRKTQTRRVAKFVSPDGDGWHIHNSGGGMLGADDDAVRVSGPDYAPFAVDDRLWVKETWHAEAAYDDTKPSEILSDACNVLYPVDQSWSDSDPMNRAGKTRVSIFMPRWASRLTLTVTAVRVERLQDISRADAIAEGLTLASNVLEEFWRWPEPHHENLWLSPPAAYRHLWNAINGAGAWNANPWVVAVSFDVREGNIDG